jgi:hypothetical protein
MEGKKNKCNSRFPAGMEDKKGNCKRKSSGYGNRLMFMRRGGG